MKTLLILIFISIFSSDTFSQPQNSSATEDFSSYTFFAEIMPKPIGGTEGIASRLQYTEEAIQAGVEGTVYIQTYINEDGYVKKVKVHQGLGYGLNQSACDAILNTKFTPAKNKGIPVKIFILVPVQFKLD